MARPKSYRELIVWQKAMDLAEHAYQLEAALPRSEHYGLLQQLKRCAVSVPSNISEGHGRLTDPQFKHFLGNARGSLSELLTQIELMGRLGYLTADRTQEFMEKGAEVARLLNGLIAVLGSGR
jgi:four helix bundle protein